MSNLRSDSRDLVSQGSFELDDGLPHDDCDYFAVYPPYDPFLPEALAEHEIEPAYWDQTI